ncbi:MAG TPA: amidohydrolase family protein [Actinomycetales bacterium]|nr:amidohydrolase family protein [Actinomycetales bacterium]
MDIIDSHFHIIGARDLRPDRAFAPPPFTVDRYLQLTDRMADAARWSRVAGGVVFGGSLQTREETLAEALEELELEAQSRGFAREDGRNFVGVITGTTELGSDRILALDAKGIRGIRFNLLKGQEIAVGDLEALARKVHDLAGWTTDVNVDIAARPDVADVLPELPAAAVNHLGMSEQGIERVAELAGAGVRVKASGFGRLDFPVAEALDRIHSVNPRALMFGTDLPGTHAPRRFDRSDVDVILDVLGEWEMPRVMRDNALAFYKFD